MAKRSRTRQMAEESFWTQVDKGDGTGCWLWNGPRNNRGYGRIWIGGRGGYNIYAHRLAYELLVGPIPEGLTIDHVKANGCISRACVKAIADEYGPAHLEAVTTQENTRRHWVGYDTCRHGHPYDEANTHWYRGHRFCRACNRDGLRRRNGYKGLGRPEQRTH